jgi:hypothetical protein
LRHAAINEQFDPRDMAITGRRDDRSTIILDRRPTRSPIARRQSSNRRNVIYRMTRQAIKTRDAPSAGGRAASG